MCVCACVCVSVCETEGDMDDICFPGYYQVPIDVTAGWAAFPVYTRSPWSNVSKVLAQGNDNNTQYQNVLSANQTYNFLISMPLS